MVGITTGAPAGLLLDQLSATSIHAVSTRKLRAAYSGNALRAVQSTAGGGGQQDIGFTGNDLNTAALLSFAGAHDAGATVLYDQSPVGTNNASTTNAGQSVTNSPLIVNGGSLVPINSRPAMQWTNTTAIGADSYFASTQIGVTGSGPTYSEPLTFAFVLQLTSTGSGNMIDATVFNAGRVVCGTINSGLNWVMYAGGTTVTPTSPVPDTSLHACFWIFNGTSSHIYIDGTDASGVAGTDPGTNALFASTVMIYGYTPALFLIPEMLIFPSAISAGDRNTIRSSFQSYWGTP